MLAEELMSQGDKIAVKLVNNEHTIINDDIKQSIQSDNIAIP
jgi:hypothetical protein